MEERSFWYNAFMGQVEPSFFAVNKDELDMANQTSVRLGTFVGMGVTLLVLISTYFVEVVAPMRMLYAGSCLLYAFGTLFSWSILRGARGWGRLGIYLLALLSNIGAATVSTFFSPHDSAAIFYIIMFITSMLILDRPIGPVLLSCVSMAAFCMLTVIVKSDSPAVMQTDLLNGFFILLLCVWFDCYIINIRLKNLEAVRLFQALSETDSLTGLASKAAMEQLCRSYLSAGRAQSCALLMVDIDDFKRINDTLGHAAGDEVLHRAGEAMRCLFRESDVVGRFGGDEFLVLMKNISDPAAAVNKADQLRQALSAIMPAGRPLECSVGVATAQPGDGTGFATLFARADTALYSSKNAGKNRCTLYTSAESELRETAS